MVAPSATPPAPDAAFVAPSPAPVDAHANTHPVALMGHFGYATPYGALGLALDVVPSRFLGIEAGVGTNFSDPEVALMPRARIPFGRYASFLTLGAGASYLRRYYGQLHNGI